MRTAVYSIVDGLHQEKQREKARKEAASFVKKTARQFCRALLEGDKDGKGPMGYLRQQQGNLKKQLEKLQVERQSIEEQKNSQVARKNNYESLKNAALKRLGNLDGEGEDDK